ncbi:aminomethyl-transferring glycine dehydrogenase subunit GcvPA [Geomonas sp. RF6]|uniref:aminomethyl-transferring glycine dehydrogenase subunit GcvPA n=1 Tax=Geomonas sp. RF6 TaxID=2897342 RepID=UPI001E4E0332|nr:aminomethyl-transferring glycine dehydrogenase subunit GcvPA [Geomonas sp. RF6]UFS71674.1 aminomethyl-transferring glycine dehydrogenase subunit GcvPA [Geomonas sp. RF6]
MTYCPNTPEEIREMLSVIGVETIEDLFAPIPKELRARSFDLPPGISEFELMDRARQLAQAGGSGIVPFIGGGLYDHLIPATVDHLGSRAEFATSYTPYQPECSQGTLQALYEYQSGICRLTGMEVSNASLYDGGTALAEGALMALRVTNRNAIVLDQSVNPLHREIVRGYLAGHEAQLVEIEAKGCEADLERLSSAISGETAAVLVQNPNFFGSVADFTALAERAHQQGALLVVSCYPISLGLVKSPGEMGADIAVGEGQSLGNPLSFGGPAFGLIAATKSLIRNLPGRIVGETIDRSGRRGYVLTLQAREQHIKRHKATSNICTNQSLCALRGMIFMTALGADGFRELAQLNYDKAEHAKKVLALIDGVTLENRAPTFNEFTLTLPTDAGSVVQRLLARGIAAGVPLGSYYPGRENSLVVTVTERRSREQIEKLAEGLQEAVCS